MSKAMTILGMVVAGLVGLVFVLDLAVGIPFDRANMVMDIGALIAAAILGYLSWDALREVR
jgi:high-affinity Fe2+/Pb2+ permease